MVARAKPGTAHAEPIAAHAGPAVAPLRILGIDPGSRITGVGVVEERRGVLHHIHSGTIKPRAEDPALRLEEIFTGLSELIVRHRPQQAAVEKVFMAKNARSALVLGEARGAAVCAAACAGLPVIEYSARSIKQAVVGYGAADKQQVQHMVRALLAMTSVPPTDAADALACAICHIHGHTRRPAVFGNGTVAAGR